jgi:tRNA (guanine-N7-)-methyltransferase
MKSTVCAASAQELQSGGGQRKTLTFQELGIDKDLYNKSSGIRFRQHVNPLKKELQEPTKPLEWSAIYEDPTKPLILDIGAGYGRFLLGLMQIEKQNNALGLEIREPIIKRANEWAKHLGLDNRVHFVRSNATVSISTVLETYPGPIELVTIQFPDPHFKKKHRKRRIVQENLVRDVANVLAQGGQVLLQSDILDVAADMRDKFEIHSQRLLQVSPDHHNGEVFFEEPGPEGDDQVEEEGTTDHALPELVWKEHGWLQNNPLPVRTERECLVLEKGGSVYRVLLVKE